MASIISEGNWNVLLLVFQTYPQAGRKRTLLKVQDIM